MTDKSKTPDRETAGDLGEPHTIRIPTVIPKGKTEKDARDKHRRQRGRATLKSIMNNSSATVQQVHRGHKAIIDQDPNVEITASIVYRDQLDKAGRTVFEIEQFDVAERFGAGAMAGMFTTPSKKVREERLPLIGQALIERATVDAAEKGLPYGHIYALRIDRDGAEEAFGRIVAQSEYLDFDNSLAKALEQEVYGRYEELDIAVSHIDNLFVGVGIGDQDDLAKFLRRKTSSSKLEHVMAEREAASDAQKIGKALGVSPRFVGHALAFPGDAASFVTSLPRHIGSATRLFIDGLTGLPIFKEP